MRYISSCDLSHSIFQVHKMKFSLSQSSKQIVREDNRSCSSFIHNRFVPHKRQTQFPPIHSWLQKLLPGQNKRREHPKPPLRPATLLRRILVADEGRSWPNYSTLTKVQARARTIQTCGASEEKIRENEVL